MIFVARAETDFKRIVSIVSAVAMKNAVVPFAPVRLPIVPLQIYGLLSGVIPYNLGFYSDESTGDAICTYSRVQWYFHA